MKSNEKVLNETHIGVLVVAALAVAYGIIAIFFVTTSGCVEEIERQKPMDESGLGVEETEDPSCEVTDNGTGAPLCSIDSSIVDPGTERMPIKAPLTITSVPAGAKIYIDGVEARDLEDILEVTPSELTVTPGDHTIELEYPERYQFVPEGTKPILDVPVDGAEAHYELYCEVEGYVWYREDSGTMHDYLVNGETDGMPTVENIPGGIGRVCMTSANSGTGCPELAAVNPDVQITFTVKYDCSAFTIHVYDSWADAEASVVFTKFD